MSNVRNQMDNQVIVSKKRGAVHHKNSSKDEHLSKNSPENIKAYNSGYAIGLLTIGTEEPISSKSKYYKTYKAAFMRGFNRAKEYLANNNESPYQHIGVHDARNVISQYLKKNNLKASNETLSSEDFQAFVTNAIENKKARTGCTPEEGRIYEEHFRKVIHEKRPSSNVLPVIRKRPAEEELKEASNKRARLSESQETTINALLALNNEENGGPTLFATPTLLYPTPSPSLQNHPLLFSTNNLLFFGPIMLDSEPPVPGSPREEGHMQIVKGLK